MRIDKFVGFLQICEIFLLNYKNPKCVVRKAFINEGNEFDKPKDPC